MRDEYVSVIVVNYGDTTSTRNLLQNLKEHVSNIHVILVDNYSNETHREELKEFSNANESVDVLLLDENFGYSGAVNTGIIYAEEKYDAHLFWVLNNDIILKDDALNPLKTLASSMGYRAIVGSTLLNISEDLEVQSIGGEFNKFLGTTHHIKKSQNIKHLQGFRYMDVGYVVGASVFFSKKVLREIGYWDDDFFLYYEDVDFSLRAKRNGIRVCVALGSAIYHSEGASTGVNANSSTRSSNIDLIYIRSLKRILIKHGNSRFYIILAFGLRLMRRLFQGDIQGISRLVKIFSEASR